MEGNVWDMNLPTDWCRSCFRERGLRTGGRGWVERKRISLFNVLVRFIQDGECGGGGGWRRREGGI